MDIIHYRLVPENELPENATATVHQFCIEVTDINQVAEALVLNICDTSWIDALDPIPRASYEATANRTIQRLVEIFNSTGNNVSSEFGEYMVSMAAGQGLNEQLNHIVLPLSELWKEKLIGNGGFDFHTVSPSSLFNFGEAKYNASTNSYNDAAEQIERFIVEGKDSGDAIHLQYFSQEEAITNLLGRARGFCAAFSINSEDHELILANSLENQHIQNLILGCNELMIIGVKVSPNAS